MPVIDHWWQTETGWAIAGNPMGLGMLPVKHGSPTVAMPGYDVRIVDEQCKEVPAGQMGSIVVKLPLPPSCLPTLWQQDERFKESYLAEFPGYYKTADAGFKDEDGYLFIMGRTDDIINVAGHRLSTGGMEEVLARHKDVAECAVIGIADALKGEVPCGFIVLKAGVNRAPSEIEKEIVALVREKIGPVAAFKLAITVPRLPKTRSGKILRGTMKKIADGEAWNMPATIEDPESAGRDRRGAEGQGRRELTVQRTCSMSFQAGPRSIVDAHGQRLDARLPSQIVGNATRGCELGSRAVGQPRLASTLLRKPYGREGQSANRER